MNRNVKFDPSQNSAKNFVFLERDLLRIATQNGISIAKVIDDFIMDLQNVNNESYEVKVKDVEINGSISAKLANSLIAYMNKVKKSYKQKECAEEKRKQQESKTQELEMRWAKIQEDIDKSILDRNKGTEKEIIERLILDIKEGNYIEKLESKDKKYILRRLNGRIDMISKIEEDRKREKEEREKQIKQREIEIENAKKAMKEIEEVVEREYSKLNIKNKANYLTRIRDEIKGKKPDRGFDLDMGEIAEEHLLQLIDVKINTEKDQVYYDQVKKFTNDFCFLREYPEIPRALQSVKKVKFTDKEAYDRYCSLRSELQKGYDERLRIEELLERDDVDAVDKRILNERKVVIDKEISRRKGEMTK